MACRPSAVARRSKRSAGVAHAASATRIPSTTDRSTARQRLGRAGAAHAGLLLIEESQSTTKSANQRCLRALTNLGFLYEQGLGVPKEKS